MPPRLGIAFLCSWKQLNSVLARCRRWIDAGNGHREPVQGSASIRAGAGGCQVPVSPCWHPGLAPAPQPVLVLLPQKRCREPRAVHAVCLSCSRPESQQEQSCFPVAGVLQPALGQGCCLSSGAPPGMGMCVTVPLPGSGVMSCCPARLSPWPLLQLSRNFCLSWGWAWALWILLRALGMFWGSPKAPVFPRRAAGTVLGRVPVPPSPPGSLSSSAGPAASPGAGQWIFVQARRLGANFGLNFPVEHIGIRGVCDSWFGCWARRDRVQSKDLASGWMLLYLALKHSVNRSYEYWLFLDIEVPAVCCIYAHKS